MERETFINQLFWFYQYKREYLKYTFEHKRLRLTHINDGVAYFTAMRPSEEKISELGAKVLQEIDHSLATLPSTKTEAYLQEIQNFLDTVYNDLDVEYATIQEDLKNPGIPSSIPSIQNLIRKEYIDRFDTAGIPSVGKAAGNSDSFNDVLSEAGKLILPDLKKQYFGKRPKQLVIMLGALRKGGYIEPDLWAQDDKAAIRRMLIGTFGGSWSHTAINKQLDAYSDPNDQQQREIDIEKRRIDGFVKS